MTNSKEYNAKYYQEHKQQIVEKKKKHYEEHKEEILARNKRWMENNRERWNEYMRERRKTNGNIHEPPKDFKPEHLKRMGVSISKGGEE